VGLLSVPVHDADQLFGSAQVNIDLGFHLIVENRHFLVAVLQVAPEFSLSSFETVVGDVFRPKCRFLPVLCIYFVHESIILILVVMVVLLFGLVFG